MRAFALRALDLLQGVHAAGQLHRDVKPADFCVAFREAALRYGEGVFRAAAREEWEEERLEEGLLRRRGRRSRVSKRKRGRSSSSGDGGNGWDREGKRPRTRECFPEIIPHVIEPFAGVDTNFSVPDRVKPGLVVQGFCASLPQLLLISSSAFLQTEKERTYLS